MDRESYKWYIIMHKKKQRHQKTKFFDVFKTGVQSSETKPAESKLNTKTLIIPTVRQAD